MRRKDREITDTERMIQIIEACDTCRLGLSDGVHVYVVPLSFGFRVRDGRPMLYFHCAGEGKKLEMLRRGAEVAFELDRSFGMRSLPGGNYTMEYQSVCGHGIPVFLETREEKEEALRILLSHYSADTMPDYPEAVYEKTCAFRLDVTEMTGKENRRKQ